MDGVGFSRFHNQFKYFLFVFAAVPYGSIEDFIEYFFVKSFDLFLRTGVDLA